MPATLHYLGLYDWLKFETNLTRIRGVTFNKPSRSGLKLYFLLLQRHFKFENLGTKSRTGMTLGRDMYHLNTFYIPKKAVNASVAGNATKKSPKNAIKFRKSPI